MNKGKKIFLLIGASISCSLVLCGLINIRSNASEVTSSNVKTNISKSNDINKSSSENESDVIETEDSLQFVITQVNDKKAKTRAARFAEYFSRQQFSMIVDMEVKDAKVNSLYTVDYFKNIYNTYFLGNKYVTCSKYKYYGYSKKTDSHLIDVYIKGKYRINKITLTFNKNWGLKEYVYDSYTEPVPEISNYYTEELIKIGEKNLNGLLTIPKNYNGGPVAILIQGFGYHNADMTVGENRIFADIAHELAKSGVAVIRYNERFNQCADLAKSNNTIYTEIIDDAVAAVKYASNNSKINKNKIFIVGHDIGGTVAPEIANICPEVRGIVCLGSSPRKILDVLYDQKILALAEINKFKEIKDKEKKEKKISDADYNNDIKYVQEVKNTLKVSFNNIKVIRNLKTFSDKMIFGQSEVYWKSLNDINVEKTVEKLKIPMLIMQGMADVEVTANRDYIEWLRIIDDKANCSCKKYEELNHYFMKSGGKTILDINDEYNVKGTVEIEPIKDMVKFMTTK